MIAKAFSAMAVCALVFTAAPAATATPPVSSWLEYLLFSPTYNPRFVPDARGTPYDCRAARSSGTPHWRGLVGGRKFDDDRMYQISREACFATETECRGYLIGMEGYIDIFFTQECRFRG